MFNFCNRITNEIRERDNGTGINSIKGIEKEQAAAGKPKCLRFRKVSVLVGGRRNERTTGTVLKLSRVHNARKLVQIVSSLLKM